MRLTKKPTGNNNRCSINSLRSMTLEIQKPNKPPAKHSELTINEKYNGSRIQALKITGSKKYKVGKENPSAVAKIPPIELEITASAILLELAVVCRKINLIKSVAHNTSVGS